jgi:hypothetical protein
VANREKGDVDIEIDGARYTMRLDLNAMCEAEAAVSTPTHPVSWQELMVRTIGPKQQMSAMRALIWASLRAHHPSLTLSDAGRLLQTLGGAAGLAALTSAIEAAMPTQKGVAAKRPPKARRSGPGGRSTSGPGASGSNGTPSGG